MENHVRKGWSCFILLTVFSILVVLLQFAPSFRGTIDSDHRFFKDGPSFLLHDEGAVSGLGCMRQCSHYRNKILYTHPNREGLDDRSNILRHTANLAGYLCATVVYRNPAASLNYKHNHMKYVSTEVTWSDIYDFRFYDKNRTLSVDDSGKNRDAYTSPQYRNWQHVYTENRSTILEDFENLESLSFQPQQQHMGFVWKIGAEFYGWNSVLAKFIEMRKPELGDSRRKMQPKILDRTTVYKNSNITGCQYTSMDPPKMVRFLVDDVWRTAKSSLPEAHIFGYLHIRRNDAVGQCDTSLSRLKSYFACSFRNTAKYGKLGLLFSSDEGRGSYRKNVTELIRSQGNVSPLDLDALVMSRVYHWIGTGELPRWTLNNFYIYNIIVHTSKLKELGFRMEQRRFFTCPSCTNVSRQIGSHLSSKQRLSIFGV